MWCSSLPLHTVVMMHRLQHVAIPASDIEQYFINLQDSVMWGWGGGGGVPVKVPEICLFPGTSFQENLFFPSRLTEPDIWKGL